MTNLDAARELFGYTTTRQPETARWQTLPTPEQSEDSSDGQPERQPSSRHQQDSPDQEASQKSKYLVQVLRGNRTVRSIIVADRTKAVSLAYDTMQFAATSYNAIQDRDGNDHLVPERSQYADNDSLEFDGQIIVEWAIFPDQGATWAARVTVVPDDYSLDDQSSPDEDEEPDAIILIF